MVKVTEHEKTWKEYLRGLDFNARLGLNETVRTNEDFFVGKQWEGVEANGLPTPVFNFLKRVVLFTIAQLTSGNVKMVSSLLGAPKRDAGPVADVLDAEFDRLFEVNKLGQLIRELMRNAAVDGDGCTYTYWDTEVRGPDGELGAPVTEIIENNRVFFGNPNDRRVQKQPYIIISGREMVHTARRRARDNGQGDIELIVPDDDEREINPDHLTDDKVTVLLKLWRDEETGEIWASESTKNAVIREPWSTGLTRYPITWLSWDYVQDCYHGQAMITGLIPNQIFINKLFAMSMISLMTTAYPKVVYDKTRIARWDNRVGAAIPISGGDVNNVARIIDPAQISPQIAQFIDLSIGYTQTFLGATNAALGDVRPDNTSAIIALQKASAVPNELTRRSLYDCIEELGRIYIDFMGEYYGTREIALPSGEDGQESKRCTFDFSKLAGLGISIKLDVGASSYWSEITSMQTLDNLMMKGHLSLTDYLERVPEGYITKKQELLDKLREAENTAAPVPVPVQDAAGGAIPGALPALPGAGDMAPTQINPAAAGKPGGGIHAMMAAVKAAAGAPGSGKKTTL